MSPADPCADLTVVIVSYNSGAVILHALEPIISMPGIDIVVVDNASSDSTVAKVESSFPSVRLIKMTENLGFSKAVNLAIESSTSRNILLLNPDAVVSSECVYRLLDEGTAPGVGIVAPLIRDPTDRLNIVSAGHFPTIRRMFFHFAGLSRFSKALVGLQGHYLLPVNISLRKMDVEWVTGACMLFTKEIWKTSNGLSERWFMYAEDIDFCHRVKAHGSSVVLLTDIHASHLVGQSDSTSSFSANPSWVLNLHDFYDSELAPSKMHSVLWCFVVSAGLLTRSVLYRMKARLGRGQDSLVWTKEGERFEIFARAVNQRARTMLLSIRRARSRVVH